jgi:uncharacterized ion transporter superfamily protein YfcC
MKDWVAIVGGILAILTVIGAIIRKLYRIEKSVEYRKEESIILIKATMAICDGLIQLKCNGPVTECRKDLNEYLIKRGE